MATVSSDPSKEAQPSSHARSAELPGAVQWLRPLVNVAAAAPVGVHTKLLAGFLAGAILLLLMAGLSEIVIGRMSQRVSDLTQLEDRLDRARQMEYQITAQSHYRAMALLTNDSSYNQEITNAKQIFSDNLDALDQSGAPDLKGILARIHEANDRYALAGQQVLDLYNAGQNDAAMQLHLGLEHPISHELEAAMRQIEADEMQQMAPARAAYESDRAFLAAAVWAAAAASLALALALGFALSWSFIVPVRRINLALATIARGDFLHRVSVPNRDEFGSLAANLNSTSAQLQQVYGQLRAVSENLQAVVDNALDGIITLDGAGSVRTLNPVAHQMFQSDGEVMVGQPI